MRLSVNFALFAALAAFALPAIVHGEGTRGGSSFVVDSGGQEILERDLHYVHDLDESLRFEDEPREGERHAAPRPENARSHHHDPYSAEMRAAPKAACFSNWDCNWQGGQNCNWFTCEDEPCWIEKLDINVILNDHLGIDSSATADFSFNNSNFGETINDIMANLVHMVANGTAMLPQVVDGNTVPTYRKETPANMLQALTVFNSFNLIPDQCKTIDFISEDERVLVWSGPIVMPYPFSVPYNVMWPRSVCFAFNPCTQTYAISMGGIMAGGLLGFMIPAIPGYNPIEVKVDMDTAGISVSGNFEKESYKEFWTDSSMNSPLEKIKMNGHFIMGGKAGIKLDGESVGLPFDVGIEGSAALLLNLDPSGDGLMPLSDLSDIGFEYELLFTAKVTPKIDFGLPEGAGNEALGELLPTEIDLGFIVNTEVDIHVYQSEFLLVGSSFLEWSTSANFLQLHEICGITSQIEDICKKIQVDLPATGLNVMVRSLVEIDRQTTPEGRLSVDGTLKVGLAFRAQFGLLDEIADLFGGQIQDREINLILAVGVGVDADLPVGDNKLQITSIDGFVKTCVQFDDKEPLCTCQNDSQCDEGESCVGGFCGKCANDAACADNEYCEIFGDRECHPKKAIGSDCQRPNQCIQGWCPALVLKCIECKEESDCPSGEWCANGVGGDFMCHTKASIGQSCEWPKQCQSGFCPSAQGKCTRCSADNDAGCSATQYCKNGILGWGSSDFQCYDKNNVGVPCSAANQCKTGNCFVTCKCNSNSDCSGSSSGPFCGTLGNCIQCQSDSNCSSTQYCRNGAGGDFKCYAKKSIGQSCEWPKHCQSGFCPALQGACTQCSADSNDGCTSTQYCKNGVGGDFKCYAKQSVGASCSAPKQCKSGNCLVMCKCNSNSDCAGNSSGSICGYGGNCIQCQSDSNCSSTQYCKSGVGGDFKCYAKNSIGQSCNAPKQCQSGFCPALKLTCTECSADNNDGCSSTQYCKNGALNYPDYKCYAKQNVGASCSAAKQCKSANCFITCKCNSNSDCSGNSSGSICGSGGNCIECNGDGNCPSGKWCRYAGDKTCQWKKSRGSSCTRGGQCTSGTCNFIFKCT